MRNGLKIWRNIPRRSCQSGWMTCLPKAVCASKGAELVSEVLQEIASSELTLERVTDPKEEATWNKLVKKHHYLKEHRMVGESLRYVAKRNGKWIALLGWSSAAFHLWARWHLS